MTLTTIPDVEHTMRSYAAMTAEAVRRHLGSGEPRAHLYDLVADYPGRPGKGLRPSLCLASCGAFGGHVEEALPSAAAIELFHNAFLVHDDVEDESALRRGQPTLHTLHGTPLAINTGDALAVAAHAPLRQNRGLLGSAVATRIDEEFDLMLRITLEGQAMELGWRRENRVRLTPADYVELVVRKTCWYTTIQPLRVGAIIGTLGRVDVTPLTRFGSYLGTAFQITDDVLNLTGEEDRYGKERLGDIYEGKRTLMMIHLLNSLDDPDRLELETFLSRARSERTASEVDDVLSWMMRHGSLAFAAEFGRGIARAAESLFDEVFAGVASSPERQFLQDLIGWMLQREA